MFGADPLLRARDPAQLTAQRRLTVVYDDRPIVAMPEDTVTSALLRAGVVATSRGLKYRRPRGPFCLQGDCGTCLVRIDGVPNRRACMTAVREGMRVEPQNRVLPGGLDPTALVDRMFATSLDHHHLMVRPRIVNRVMQEVARNLAGLGTLPEGPAEAARWEAHAPDVVVVGGGRSGRAAAARLRAGGLDVACLERFDAAAGASDRAVHSSTAVFGIYPAEGLVAAIDTSADVQVLRTFAPAHIVFATGARDVMTPLANNDLPGVFAAHGLVLLLARTNSELACPSVVIGEPRIAAGFADRLGASALAAADVYALLGRTRVEAVSTAQGKREVGCVALAGPRAPASELARQAGASVTWNGDGFAVTRDASGRCGGDSWSLWACGEVCGVAADQAADDGERVAASVLDAAHGRTTRRGASR